MKLGEVINLSVSRAVLAVKYYPRADRNLAPDD